MLTIYKLYDIIYAKGGVDMDIRVKKIILIVYGDVYLDCYLKHLDGFKNKEIVDMYGLKSLSSLTYILKKVKDFHEKLENVL